MLNSYSEKNSLIGSLTVLKWIEKRVIKYLQTFTESIFRYLKSCFEKLFLNGAKNG